MSKYTTGELAKLCGVSVRTVQYYDARGILIPSQLTDGGRRLYSEEDLRRLKVICFLRELDLPINSIGQLLAEEEPGAVITLLLEQQAKLLQEEIGQRQKKLERLEQLRRELRTVEHFSVETIGDIAQVMESKNKLRKLRLWLLVVALPLEAVEIGALLLWILKGIWWPYVLSMVLIVLACIGISRSYFRRVAYICPKCHTVFRPKFWEAFFAGHTPNTRKLTCVHCGHKGYCVETYGGDGYEKA